MTRSVVTAVSDRWESALVTTLERGTDAQIARRCPDLADLLAVAGSGLAQVAMVSADIRGLDRTALDHLGKSQVSVVGVYPPGDEIAELHLRQLGIAHVIPADASGEVIQAVLDALESHQAAPGHDGAHGTSGPGPEAALGSPGQGTPDQPVGAAGSGVPGAGHQVAVAGSIIAVWGPAGAPGRTTVAVNLASELARLGQPTLLVDADTYGGCVAQVLSLLDEAPGLAAATRSADQGSLDLAMLARLAPEVCPGLRVLTGIPKAERWPELRAAPLEHVLSLARRLVRFTVVDCGFSLEDDEELSYDTLAPRRNAATLTSLSVADAVMAVGAGDPIGLQRLVRGLQELGTVASPTPTVVVNRVRASAVGSHPQRRIGEALTRFAGIDDLRFVPDDPATLDEALLTGRLLAESAPDSDVRQSIRALASEVCGVAVPRIGGLRGGGRRSVLRRSAARRGAVRSSAPSGSAPSGSAPRSSAPRDDRSGPMSA